MTSGERDQIAQLRLELLGEDGQGGAIGALRTEFRPALTFYQRASGVLALGKWLGPTGLVGAVIGILWTAGAFR